MSERIRLDTRPPSRPQEPGEQRVLISLTAAEWQVVAGLLSQSPYRLVYRILEQIEKQAHEHDRFNAVSTAQAQSEAALRLQQLQAEQTRGAALERDLQRAQEDAETLRGTNQRLRREIHKLEEKRRQSDGRRRGRKPKAPTEAQLVS